MQTGLYEVATSLEGKQNFKTNWDGLAVKPYCPMHIMSYKIYGMNSEDRNCFGIYQHAYSILIRVVKTWKFSYIKLKNLLPFIGLDSFIFNIAI